MLDKLGFEVAGVPWSIILHQDGSNPKPENEPVVNYGQRRVHVKHCPEQHLLRACTYSAYNIVSTLDKQALAEPQLYANIASHFAYQMGLPVLSFEDNGTRWRVIEGPRNGHYRTTFDGHNHLVEVEMPEEVTPKVELEILVNAALIAVDTGKDNRRDRADAYRWLESAFVPQLASQQVHAPIRPQPYRTGDR